jgi:hypothetical protein
MDISANTFGTIGTALVLIAGVVYLLAAVRGKVYSNKVTWGVWTPVTAMVAYSYYQVNGWVPSLWVLVAYAVVTALTFIALHFAGKGGEWTWVEKTVLPAAGVVIILWAIFHSGSLGMYLTLLLDVIGAIPLVVSAYKHPEGEYPLGWYLGFAGNAVNMLAVGAWSFDSAVYPAYLFVLTLVISILVTLPKARHEYGTAV